MAQIYKSIAGLSFILAVKKRMRILVVAATGAEIAPLISDFGFSVSDLEKAKGEMLNAKVEKNKSEIGHPTSDISFLVTGVGMVATAFSLGKHLALNQYDFAINLGIAGSFDRQISLGSVLEVTEDTIAELGAEDGPNFLPLSLLGFGEETFEASATLNDYFKAKSIQQATAITVNTVHGSEASIQNITQRLNPRLESMEGAAFFYACKQAGVPGLQIRAVSNYVEKRNCSNWQIGLAIKNLNNFAVELLRSLKPEG